MKALRAQINPHFIFNCLNSIHRFMDASRTAEAGQYLTKFSNLVRVVLENSMHTVVPLHEDIFALQLYVEMEQLRMDHYFDYVLEIDPNINDRKTLVPPLILQPFVENAIWHGLNNKPARGKLFISVVRFDDMLKYIVQDDGVKVNSKDDTKLQDNIKKKSLGISLTRERIDIINEGRESKANFLITEIIDDQKNYCGTRVELWLPYEEE
jgi:LytS/YehU family sensor histidine kinase